MQVYETTIWQDNMHRRTFGAVGAISCCICSEAIAWGEPAQTSSLGALGA
jgi:hypothetical protein